MMTTVPISTGVEQPPSSTISRAIAAADADFSVLPRYPCGGYSLLSLVATCDRANCTITPTLLLFGETGGLVGSVPLSFYSVGAATFGPVWIAYPSNAGLYPISLSGAASFAIGSSAPAGAGTWMISGTMQ